MWILRFLWNNFAHWNRTYNGGFCGDPVLSPMVQQHHKCHVHDDTSGNRIISLNQPQTAIEWHWCCWYNIYVSWQSDVVGRWVPVTILRPPVTHVASGYETCRTVREGPPMTAADPINSFPVRPLAAYQYYTRTRGEKKTNNTVEYLVCSSVNCAPLPARLATLRRFCGRHNCFPR